MEKVIVYSKYNCPNCEHVKWGLEAQGIEFDERMIEMPKGTTPEDVNTEEYKIVKENIRQFHEYGFMAAPVTVFPNGKVMDGFHHGKFVDRMREMGYDV